MTNNPQIFHGEWWIPARKDHDNQLLFLHPERMMGHERKYTGTLTYHGNQDSTLELFHIPSDFHVKHYRQNDVIWGKDANGNLFTLFNVVMKEMKMGDFTCTKFVVELILMGKHILSLDDTCFNRCIVQFPYLRNWAFQDNLSFRKIEDGYCHTLKDISKREYLVNTIIEDGINWIIRDRCTQKRTIYDLIINQVSEFVIEVHENISFRKYLKQVNEFSQFLSVALFSEQSPSGIHFENDNQTSELLFKRGNSVDPKVSTLIKFKKLNNLVPDMLRKWHECFEKVSPISGYLVDSLRKGKIFDTPDFLIIAQALDGFHKRFVNKRDGRDVRKYEEQIEVLVSQFKDVEAVKKCKINPKVLSDSRHKYSHLYPDEEKSQAVSGSTLFWLTEKCKVLLTCCILSMLGLSNHEINLCCEQSPISQIIDSLPLEID